MAYRQLVSMVPANGARGKVLQSLAFLLLKAGFLRHLRRINTWSLPLPERDWQEIALSTLDAEPTLSGFVWHLPPPDQPQTKFSAMGLDQCGFPKTFIRLTKVPISKLSPSVSVGSRTGVKFPTRLRSRQFDTWHLEECEVVLEGPHHPVVLELDQILELVSDVQDALCQEGDWKDPQGNLTPAHGDLTFWNLRQDKSGCLALIDWEDASWAPRHTDLVRYIVTAPNAKRLIAALPAELMAELGGAVEYWLREVSIRDDAPAWVSRKVRKIVENLARLRVEK